MISFVIVSWNVRDQLRRCLESILHAQKRTGEAYEIVVIDNASSDKSAQMVTSLFPSVRLIKNDTNVGFAAACNQGAAIATGSYLFFLNPDTELMADGVGCLRDFLLEQPNVGIVAPKLLYEDGELQPSVRRYPTALVMVFLLLKLHRFLSWTVVWRRYMYNNFDYQSLRAVDQVMGAAMLMPKNIFDKLNGFDSGFFIWFEEVDLCKRVKEAGYLVFFNPEVTIVHTRSKSFAQQNIIWRQRQFSRSARWYASKHFSNLGYLSVWIASWVAIGISVSMMPISHKLKEYQSTENKYV